MSAHALTFRSPQGMACGIALVLSGRSLHHGRVSIICPDQRCVRTSALWLEDWSRQAQLGRAKAVQARDESGDAKAGEMLGGPRQIVFASCCARVLAVLAVAVGYQSACLLLSMQGSGMHQRARHSCDTAAFKLVALKQLVNVIPPAYARIYALLSRSHRAQMRRMYICMEHVCVRQST